VQRGEEQRMTKILG